MNMNDINIYLEARKQDKQIKKLNIFFGIFIVIFGLYTISKLYNRELNQIHQIIACSLYGGFIIANFYNIISSISSKFIHRNDLMNIIENYINSDPEAQEYISSKKSA